MKHLTIGVFGNKEFINELGKKSTVNDIAMHHHADSTHEFTFVAANSDKIQPLLQTLQMTEVPILVLKELTSAIGEEIVGLDEMEFTKGFTILNGVNEEQYRKMVKDTTLEKYEIISNNVPEIYEKIMMIDIDRSGSAYVPIDNFFAVKGVGTVVLGIVCRGEVKKYEKMILEPLGKDATVKGIQMQDKDFNDAPGGARVGLNLKDIDVDDLKRGQILSLEPLEKTKKLTGSIQKNKFYKGDIKDNEQVIACAGLQCVTGVIHGKDIELDKEIVLQKPVLIASTKQENLRIVGKI